MAEFVCAESGETIEAPLLKGMPTIFQQQCCDCGLIHTWILARCNKSVKMTIYRDDAATNAARKKRKWDCTERTKQRCQSK